VAIDPDERVDEDDDRDDDPDERVDEALEVRRGWPPDCERPPD